MSLEYCDHAPILQWRCKGNIFIQPGNDSTNKLQLNVLRWYKALWLAVASHVTALWNYLPTIWYSRSFNTFVRILSKTHYFHLVNQQLPISPKWRLFIWQNDQNLTWKTASICEAIKAWKNVMAPICLNYCWKSTNVSFNCVFI